MADNSDDLLISVSTDLTTVKRQLRQLGQDITAATGGIQKQFDTVGKGIDKSMSTALQARVNEMVGIGTKGAKEWHGALADQGKEFERLRAKMNPIFATISRYKATVGEIQTAHRIGAISADEMTAAINRERTAALADIAAIKGRNAALADTPVMRGGRGASNFNTANIAAQFQDIAVMTQMGIANPLTIALQQGTQLSAVFNQMGGTRDVIKGIGAAFLSIVNPVSLVTIGTIAAGVAAYNYFTANEDGSANTEKALKEQADLIDRVAKKWGDALPAIRAVADEQEMLAGRADVEGAFKQKYKDTFREIGQEVSSAGNAIQDVMGLLQVSVPPNQIVAVQHALANLSETAAKNKTSVTDMNAAQKALMDAFRSSGVPVLQATADAIGELTPRLAATNAEMENLAGQEKLGIMFTSLQAVIGSINSDKARDELRTLMDQAQKGQISVADLLAELSRISGYAPDVTSIISAFRAVAEAAKAAGEAASPVIRVQTKGGPARYQPGAIDLPANAPAPTHRVDPYFDGPTKPKGSSTKAPAKTSDDRFFEDIEAIRQRTAALAQETAMVGMSYEAQTKRRAAFDLEQQALKQVREEARKKGDQDWQNAQLTPEQVAKIEEVSDAYAKQAEALRVAQQAQQDFQDWINVGRDATRGFIDDLLDGASAGEAFANVLKKIGDHLLDLAMNSLFGGGGNGGFGILGSLLGLGGGGGSFVDGAGGGLGALLGYDEGGYTGPGGRKQPAGIVHKGEVVWSQDDIRSAGGVAAVEAMRARGGVSAPTMPRLQAPANQNGPGGMGADVRVYVDQDGNWQAAVERISQTNVKAGLAQYDKGGAIRAARDLRVANQRGYIR